MPAEQIRKSASDTIVGVANLGDEIVEGLGRAAEDAAEGSKETDIMFGSDAKSTINETLRIHRLRYKITLRIRKSGQEENSFLWSRYQPICSRSLFRVSNSKASRR